MRIAFNALSARQGGGISVLTNLLPRLAQEDTKNSYFIFYSPQQSGFVQAIPNSFHKIVIKYLPRNPYIRVLWEQFIFPLYLLQHRIDILYSVGNTASVLAPCKIVLLIENANPYSLLNIPYSYKERLRNKLLRALGWLSARRAAKIRFVSENSKNLIVPQLGVSAEKCVVIPHGIAPSPQPSPPEGGEGGIEKFPLPAGEGRVRGNPYILTIGANGPHRNTLRLLQAFSILVSKYGYGGDLVVIGNTGARRWRASLDELVQTLGLRDRVIFKGEVPHRDIAMYFKDADAFVFPSLEETFGIPLLEAMAASVPVAASDCDLDPAHRGKCFNPFREICGDAAQYFNPFDPEKMAQSVNHVLIDRVLREQSIARGLERAKNYNLEDTARALVKLWDSVYNS